MDITVRKETISYKTDPGEEMLVLIAINRTTENTVQSQYIWGPGPRNHYAVNPTIVALLKKQIEEIEVLSFRKLLTRFDNMDLGNFNDILDD